MNRYELIKKFNPVLDKIDSSSPLTVGNGELCFTVDVTGLQSLYQEYYDTLPLCTMSTWGWHSKPVDDNTYQYTLDDLVMSEYDYNGRAVKYPKKKIEGNEHVYDWLRQNPHRLNLARIGFIYNKREMLATELKNINQELALYEGIIRSEFSLEDNKVEVETCVSPSKDMIAISAKSKLLGEKKLEIRLDFPYGSHTISGSDWESEHLHHTTIYEDKMNGVVLERRLDRDSYYVTCIGNDIAYQLDGHSLIITSNNNQLDLTIAFNQKDELTLELDGNIRSNISVGLIQKESKKYFESFFEDGGMVDITKSKDDRAMELQRRIILSMYLLAINSCSSTPPQETGLTCNSWYGKMHLEMYLLHCAWAPLWNQSELLERSLPWYIEHIPQAQENAARNDYKGSRWPKMIANEGIDCPSGVAPLLVWQQPHIIFMLELCYRQNKDIEFVKKYYQLIEETITFMVDFVVWNEESKHYDIVAPVIPVQECHRHDITKNPAFEVEYFRYTIKLGIEWAKLIGTKPDNKWIHVAENMSELSIMNGLYLAHENAQDSFTKYNRDHPSMLQAYGLLPNNDIDKESMERTLRKVMECWQYESLWGWDFAMMAMTATRLGLPELAIDILLLDTAKNNYVLSGNNRQILRKDLPLYLPGNGSLLLAIPMMVAGYDGCTDKTPGFPKNGLWEVEYESIEPYV